MQHVSGLAFRKRADHPLAGCTILQIIAELDQSEAARAAIETAESLARIGARSLVGTSKGAMVSELQARGGIFVPFRTETLNPFELALGVARLVRLIQTEAIDLVHARSLRAAWVGLGATRLTKTPFVTSWPVDLEPSGRVSLRLAAAFARGDRVLCGSLSLAERLEKIYSLSKGKAQVAGQGIDPLAFAPEAVEPERVHSLRRSWRLPADAPIVLLVAELAAPWLRAVLAETTRILDENDLVAPRLVLVGTTRGPTPLALAVGPVGGSVRSLGPADDLPAAFRAASAVAVPSTGDPRLCRLAIAAQAMGTPVIVPDEGALAETILAPPQVAEQGRTGWRIPPRDPRALAEAIGRILCLGASARDRLASRARTHVELHHSTRRMVADTLRAYVVVRDDHTS